MISISHWGMFVTPAVFELLLLWEVAAREIDIILGNAT
jgi:hypothetical protein